MMNSYTVKRTSFCLEPDSGPDLGSAYPGLDFFAHLVGLAREPMKPSFFFFSNEALLSTLYEALD